jgi:hypothetical protein
MTAAGRTGEDARAVLAAPRRYVGRRPAMIVDAVMSVRQDYEKPVVPLVNRFDQTAAAASLEALSVLQGIEQALFNNSPSRTATIVGIVRGLLRYAGERASTMSRPLAVGRASRTGLSSHTKQTRTSAA